MYTNRMSDTWWDAETLLCDTTPEQALKVAITIGDLATKFYNLPEAQQTTARWQSMAAAEFRRRALKAQYNSPSARKYRELVKTVKTNVEAKAGK